MMKTCFLLLVILALTACSHFKTEYAYPNEDFIRIEGNISNNLTYSILVEYATDPDKCKSRVFLYDGPDLFSYTYLPKISNSSHAVNIPMKAIDPNTKCNWKPETVSVCVDKRDRKATRCMGLISRKWGTQILPEKISRIECDETLYCQNGGVENSVEFNEALFNKTYILNIISIKPNKFKNENASKAGPDAAKTRRPF